MLVTSKHLLYSAVWWHHLLYCVTLCAPSSCPLRFSFPEPKSEWKQIQCEAHLYLWPFIILLVVPHIACYCSEHHKSPLCVSHLFSQAVFYSFEVYGPHNDDTITANWWLSKHLAYKLAFSTVCEASTSDSLCRTPKSQSTWTFWPLVTRLCRGTWTEPRVLLMGVSWTHSWTDFFLLSLDLAVLKPDLTGDCGRF